MIKHNKGLQLRTNVTLKLSLLGQKKIVTWGVSILTTQYTVFTSQLLPTLVSSQASTSKTFQLLK